MSLSNIQMNFSLYLQGLKDKNPGGKYENITNGTYNIFQYQTEFKEFISDNYNTTNSIQSMSISEILDMEIDATGKLVTPEELEAYDNATLDAQNGIVTDEGQNAEMPDALENQTLDSAAATEFVSSDVDGTVSPESADMTNMITELLGEAMQNEDFIKAFDADESNDISNEELDNFLSLANALDGDLDNFTLDDIMQGMETILNGENLTEKVEQMGMLNEEGEVVEPEEVQATNTPTSTATTTPTQSSGGSYNGGTVSGGTQAPKEKTLADMDATELQAELKTANDNLNTEQSELNAIQDGSNSELQSLQGDIDDKYEAYQELLNEVSPELAEKVDAKKKEIDENDKAIAENDKAITDQESAVSNAETAYLNAQLHTTALKGRLSELQGKESAETDSDKKAKISSLILGIQAEITKAQNAENQAEQKVKDEKQKLKDLETTRETLETTKTTLDDEMALLEDEVQNLNNEELNKALEAYNNAQTNYDTKKAELTISAQKDVTAAQDRVNEVQTAIDNLATKETLSNYSTDEYNAKVGQDILAAAKEMLDTYGSSTNYCARGVNRTMEIWYKNLTGNPDATLNFSGHGRDWDSNMEVLVERGMFTEVTDEYTSSDQLANLPAGAVVCWEASTGTGGGGYEYGHVTIADGNGGEISDHESSFIYTTIGGRSDTYRVFIPI